MDKVYTLDDNGECLAELKAMRDEMLLMRNRLECDEITPDEWRQWHAGYSVRVLTQSGRLFPGCVTNFLVGMLIWSA